MAPESDHGGSLLEPLRFTRKLMPRVWGGSNLERLLGTEAADPAHPVGESWELVDREVENSEVAEGPLQGRSLRGLMLTDAEALLGRARPSAQGHFPILVKYIDTASALSVQVHPSAEAVERIGSGAESKTEAWYVLAAEPGSLLYVGLREGVDAATFAASAATPEVVELLQPWEVEAGQLVHVPAGTVHAIGAGVTLIEVQENSDTTYRLYDWDRAGLDGKPRETHVAEALHAIDYTHPPEGPRDPVFEDLGPGRKRAELLDCPQFGLELFEADTDLELETGGVAVAYCVLEGDGRLAALESEMTHEIRCGETWLVPAAVGRHRFQTGTGGLRLFRVSTRT